MNLDRLAGVIQIYLLVAGSSLISLFFTFAFEGGL